MSVSNEALAALMAPRRVAVVGATKRETAAGNRILKHVAGPRFSGSVVGINPNYEEVEGRACYSSLEAMDESVDCAVMAVADSRIEAAVSDAIRAGVKGLVLLGRLYDASDDQPNLYERVSAMTREARMAVCGANCMGIFNSVEDARLSLSDLPGLDKPGHVALLSHSGSTWSGLGGNFRPLRFSIGVSMGNEVATGVADYINFMVSRPETRAIAMVLETVRDGEAFVAALEGADKADIPVVALKLGRSALAREFALSHSGALAGDDRIYDAIFRHHNVVSVTSLDELMDTVEVLASGRAPTAHAVGIQTDSGGERQLITDLADQHGVPLATFSQPTRDALAEVLDPGLEPDNPVDYWGESGMTVIPKVMQAIAQAPETGVVVFATNMVGGREILYGSTAALEEAHETCAKPCMMLGNISATIDPDEALRLRDKGIPVLSGTETGLKAIGHLLERHRRLAADWPSAEPSPDELVKAWRARLSSRELAPEEMMALVKAFGVSVPALVVCTSEQEVSAAIETTGFPAVLKTAQPEILHKTDVGGVVLGLADQDAVLAAYRTMAAALGPRVMVQQTAPKGVEMLVGMTNDATFGPVMTVGMGGVLVEVLNDAVMFVPPVSPDEAADLIASLRSQALLDGARGAPPADRPALALALSDLSRLAAVLGDLIGEFDVNPVLVHAEGLTAVDVLITPKGA